MDETQNGAPEPKDATAANDVSPRGRVSVRALSKLTFHEIVSNSISAVALIVSLFSLMSSCSSHADNMVVSAEETDECPLEIRGAENSSGLEVGLCWNVTVINNGQYRAIITAADLHQSQSSHINLWGSQISPRGETTAKVPLSINSGESATFIVRGGWRPDKRTIGLIDKLTSDTPRANFLISEVQSYDVTLLRIQHEMILAEAERVFQEAEASLPPPRANASEITFGQMPDFSEFTRYMALGRAESPFFLNNPRLVGNVVITTAHGSHFAGVVRTFHPDTRPFISH